MRQIFSKSGYLIKSVNRVIGVPQPMSSESEESNSSGDEDYVPPAGDQSDEEELKPVKDHSDRPADKKEPSKEEVDKVWENFKSDTSTSSFKKEESQNCKNSADIDKIVAPTSTKKTEYSESTNAKKTITVTKVYDFAGEEVKVTKEVASDSKEAKKLLNSSPAQTSGVKRPGGGLQKLLGKMGKKPKMSTLEKSRLDWQNYKEEKGIQDELVHHNKGKEGYLEKISFLERTDHRQFEKERDMRLAKLGKR